MKRTLLALSASALFLLQACGGGGGDGTSSSAGSGGSTSNDSGSASATQPGSSGSGSTPGSSTSSSSNGESSNSATGTPANGTLTASPLPRVMAPSVPAADATALREGNTAFAADLYKTLRNQPSSTNQDLFFSPLSISEALAMTYAGAQGTTASELQSTMHFTLPAARLHAAFDELDLALTSPRTTAEGTAPLTLDIANSLWGEATFTFQQPFLDTLATNYGTGIYRVDFIHAPDTARTAINDWIAGKTADKIQNLLAPGTVTGSTRLILVNAVYFNAGWSSPFSPSATAAGTFHGASGDTSAQMMTQTAHFAYGAGSGWRAISLPYDGGLTFTAILPDDLATFESSFSAATLASIDSSLQTTNVTLTLPKFKIPGATFSVKTVLQSLGTRILFTDFADLTGMSSIPLAVSDVMHQAYISVDEKGTEAAAVTGGVIGTTSMPVGVVQPVILTLDKPFVFVIRDSATGAVLFLGRYVVGS